MTVLYVLDTDHLTLLQRNHRAVITRFTALPPEVIAATIVSAMEQVRGRLAQIHRAKTASEVVRIGISKGLSAGTSGARLRSTSAPPACATPPGLCTHAPGTGRRHSAGTPEPGLERRSAARAGAGHTLQDGSGADHQGCPGTQASGRAARGDPGSTRHAEPLQG